MSNFAPFYWNDIIPCGLHFRVDNNITGSQLITWWLNAFKISLFPGTLLDVSLYVELNSKFKIKYVFLN